MKLVELVDGSYRVIDKKKRIAKLSKPIVDVLDIYFIRWVSTTDEVITDEYTELTDEASSYKQLLHYVTKSLLDDIPIRYIHSYLLNNKRS